MGRMGLPGRVLCVHSQKSVGSTHWEFKKEVLGGR